MSKRNGIDTKIKISLTGTILSALCLLNNGIRHTTIVNAQANHKIAPVPVNLHTQQQAETKQNIKVSHWSSQILTNNFENDFTSDQQAVLHSEKLPIKHDIKIKYVDTTNNKVVKTDIVSAAANGTIKYQAKMTSILNALSGYQVNYGKTNLPLTSEHNIKLPAINKPATYTVALDHKTTTIKPGHKNPVTNETEKLAKTITQTVKYRGAGKDFATNEQKLHFTRNAKIDLVTGKATYLDWQEKKHFFKDVVSPKINGYEPDIEVVQGSTVTANSKDVTKIVTYTKKSTPNYQITIDYVDGNGKKLKTDLVKGKPDTTIAYQKRLQEVIKGIANNGYEINQDKTNLPLDENNDIKLPNSVNSNVSYQVVLKHKIVGFNYRENNPFTGEKDDNLIKPIKQVVHYTGTDEQLADNVQKLSFTRNAQVDMVTGKVTYLDWNESKLTFQDVIPPKVIEHEPNTKLIKGATVTPDDFDVNKTVMYHSTEEVVYAGVNATSDKRGIIISGLLAVAAMFVSYIGIHHRRKHN